jgi:3'(2'), 5'-bisphosphate nucleotidase
VSGGDDAGLMAELERIALEAGAAVMRVYAAAINVDYKTDSSPVTDADRCAEDVILKRLAEVAPGAPVLSEEASAAGRDFVPGAEFFLVDPLDGTKEFISRNGEFTVNIALVQNGAPVAGVVYAPALERLYLASRALGAWRIDGGGERRPIRARRRPKQGLVAVASRNHRSPETDEYLKSLDIASFAETGSSLKFCLIAEGAADVYPRFGRTMEWDTGAGQAVLEAAGGSVVELPSGAPLAYGKAARGYDNPHFIARGA